MMPNSNPFTSSTKSMLVLLIGILGFISGCGGHARLDAAPEFADQASIEKLIDDIGEYFVYFTATGGPEYGNVAIIFDPKEDESTLIARNWTVIEDRQFLRDTIARMQHAGYHSGAYKILGPDEQFFGYLVAAKRWLIAKAVDEKTMQVYDFPRPPTPP